MSTQHIGAAGELLDQYELLKLEIDSARLITDSGVDLVVYTPSTGEASTVQVKTVRSPTPAGGRGRAAIGWNFGDSLRGEPQVFVPSRLQAGLRFVDRPLDLSVLFTEPLAVERFY
jgi:hypothetical protein